MTRSSGPIVTVSLWLIGSAPPFHERVGRRLSGRGYAVEHMLSAEGAITRLTYQRPDAIAIAARLPEMRLFEFTRWVRAVSGGTELPIVAVVRDAAEQREAAASACDGTVRHTWWTRGVAREIDRRVRLELAARAARRPPFVARHDGVPMAETFPGLGTPVR